MAKYKLLRVEEVKNLSSEPAEMRMMRDVLDSDQIALTYRRIPAGFQRAHGHTHTKIDEIIYIISGNLKIKLDDEIIEVGPKTVIKIPPEVKRGYHNTENQDVEMIVVSVQADLVNDNGGVPDPDWWPAG